MAKVGGSPFLSLFVFLFLPICYFFSPAFFRDQRGLYIPQGFNQIRLRPQIHTFLFSTPRYSSIFTSIYLIWLHFSSISFQIWSAITFDHLPVRFIGKVCRVLIFTSAQVFALPPFLGLPLLVVLLVGIPLTSLFPFTWWLQSEMFSLLYDRVFLPHLRRRLLDLWRSSGLLVQVDSEEQWWQS